MIGIILAAGDGTRLKNSTGEDCCKALKKINDTYLIEYALNNLVELGIDRACVVIGKQGELIKEAIGAEYKGLKISYVLQKQQKGLMNALVQAIDSLDKTEDILLQLADEIFVGLKTEDIKSAISEMSSDFYCGVTYDENPDKIKNNFSVVSDENQVIEKCTEKPKTVINNIKGTGFCIFSAESVRALKLMYNESSNIPNDLCDYMNSLIAQGKKGTALVVAEKEFNINTLADVQEATAFLNC